MNSNDTQTELYMDDETEAADVLDFVAERTENPAVFNDRDVVVFNYHNQPLVAHAIAEWAFDADPGVYVVPFQVSGVWGFIQRVLPVPIRNADVLAYRKGSDVYVDYTNWRRVYVNDGEEFESEADVEEKIEEIYASASEVLYHA